MKWNKYILLTSMLLISFKSNAQAFKTYSQYGYDANGNRTSTSIIYLATNLKSDTITLEQMASEDDIFKTDTSNLPEKGWQPGIYDNLGNLNIILYPNPTHGIIIIGISGITETLSTVPGNYIRIWDIQGRLVLTKNIPVKNNTIDLSQAKNGTYLLKISLGSQVKDYKIIKE
jgi:hypothetical protein